MGTGRARTPLFVLNSMEAFIFYFDVFCGRVREQFECDYAVQMN